MPEILRAGSRVAVPWKNGGGVTREVAAFPAGSGLADFDWRVSVAEVRAAGPFSRFPGVDRRMAVLEGRLALTLDARAATLQLAPGSAPIFFPGDVPAVGEPVDGPVLDLNVMTRRGRFESTVTCHTLTQVLELGPEQGTLLVLALADLSVRDAQSAAQLVRLDAARIEPGRGECRITPIAAPGSCYVVRITACA